MSNVLRLRTASDPRFNTLHREFEWGELDQNFVSLMNLIETAGTDSFPSILSFDPTFQYRPGEMPFFVSFNNNIYENVAITPHTGITPGTSESTWRHVSVGRLSHEQNTDFMLGRHSAYIGYSANIDLRIPLLRDKNDFIISNTSGTGEYTVNLITSASGNDAAVEHIFQVRIAPNQNYNIRFSSTLDMYVGNEDVILTPGHIAYFLGGVIGPSGTNRTHLLFITDKSQINSILSELNSLQSDITILSNSLQAMAFAADVVDANKLYGRSLGNWAEITMANISGLQTALQNKADLLHSHSINDINQLQSALDGKSNTVHSHLISNITNLQNELDARTPNIMVFGRLITTATTLATTDLFRELSINNPTNMNITIGTSIPIGGWINFRIDGAGRPVFVAGAGQSINLHDLAGRQFCQIYRGADVSTTQMYYII